MVHPPSLSVNLKSFSGHVIAYVGVQQIGLNIRESLPEHEAYTLPPLPVDKGVCAQESSKFDL